MIHAILITSKLPLHLWTNPSADSEKSVQATLVDYLSGRIHSGPRKMWMKTAGIQWKWRASAGMFGPRCLCLKIWKSRRRPGGLAESNVVPHQNSMIDYIIMTHMTFLRLRIAMLGSASIIQNSARTLERGKSRDSPVCPDPPCRANENAKKTNWVASEFTLSFRW
jgi:hypothetical protein